MTTEHETGDRVGANASIDRDRITVERFRAEFPRARWNDKSNAWWVPGKTAARRIERWRALEAAKVDIHADAKGRDAYLFDPIESPYLEPGLHLVVRTPFSKTVVDELHRVPSAQWDDDDRVWRVPYRSLEELRRRWPVIEAAARRNEPDERRRRREEAKGTDEYAAGRRRSAERGRHRFPIDADAMPPLYRPLSTAAYGVILFTVTSGELADKDTVEAFYTEITHNPASIWVSWRTPTLEELVKTWPSRAEPDEGDRKRGWWPATKPELMEARRNARSRERRRRDAG